MRKSTVFLGCSGIHLGPVGKADGCAELGGTLGHLVRTCSFYSRGNGGVKHSHLVTPLGPETGSLGPAMGWTQLPLTLPPSRPKHPLPKLTVFMSETFF